MSYKKSCITVFNAHLSCVFIIYLLYGSLERYTFKLAQTGSEWHL